MDDTLQVGFSPDEFMALSLDARIALLPKLSEQAQGNAEAARKAQVAAARTWLALVEASEERLVQALKRVRELK